MTDDSPFVGKTQWKIHTANSGESLASQGKNICDAVASRFFAIKRTIWPMFRPARSGALGATWRRIGQSSRLYKINIGYFNQ